jgi:hypothetical protein
VAGAIAWEATEQVKSSSLRGVGPGKPHAWELRGKKSAVEEVDWSRDVIAPSGGQPYGLVGRGAHPVP